MESTKAETAVLIAPYTSYDSPSVPERSPLSASIFSRKLIWSTLWVMSLANSRTNIPELMGLYEHSLRPTSPSTIAYVYIRFWRANFSLDTRISLALFTNLSLKLLASNLHALRARNPLIYPFKSSLSLSISCSIFGTKSSVFCMKVLQPLRYERSIRTYLGLKLSRGSFESILRAAVLFLISRLCGSR